MSFTDHFLKDQNYYFSHTLIFFYNNLNFILFTNIIHIIMFEFNETIISFYLHTFNQEPWTKLE